MGDFRFPVSIGPYEFPIELEGFRRTTNETVRQQTDESQRTGEQSLSPLDLWRRSISDFRGGAGQRDGEADDALPNRFESSVAMDVWTPGEVRPQLDDAAPVAASQKTVVRKGLGYEVAGGTVAFRSPTFDQANYTTMVELPGGAQVNDIATDGHYLYVAGTSEVYMYEPTPDATDSPVKLNDLTNADSVWYVKGRLMLAAGADLYNVTDVASTAVPAPITPSTINDQWVWSDMTGGGSFIYACGYSGETGLIYRISVRQDGTELDAPVVAAELPRGEVPYTVYAYAGLVFIGTSQGLRVAQMDAGGYLEYGPLIATGPCRTVSGWESSIYFGWEGQGANGDAGVGKIDLSSRLVDVLQPPYASFLVREGSGPSVTTEQIVFFDGVLHVRTSAGWSALSDTGRQAAATLTTSMYDFGVPEQKMFEFVQLRLTDPIVAPSTVEVDVLIDGVSAATASLQDVDGVNPIIEVGANGDTVQVVLSFTGPDRPGIARVTARAWPLPRKGEEIVLPLVLRESMEDRNGRIVRQDVKAAFDYLRGKKAEQSQVTVELFGDQLRCVIDRVQLGDNLDFLPNQSFVEGVCYVQLRSWQ